MRPFLFLIALPLLAETSYSDRVNLVRNTPGFVALWDFVKRTPDGRFAAHQAPGETHDLSLDAVNYVRDYWKEGQAAADADFPLLNRGPFGQAVRFLDEQDPSFRPLLLVPIGPNKPPASKPVSANTPSSPASPPTPGLRRFMSRKTATDPSPIASPGTWPPPPRSSPTPRRSRRSPSITKPTPSPPISTAKPLTSGSTNRKSIRSSNGRPKAGCRLNCGKRPASNPAKIRHTPPTSSIDHPKPKSCRKRASTKQATYSSTPSRKSV